MEFIAKDIVKHQFSKSLFGYDKLEVDAYLEVVSEKVDEILKRKDELEIENDLLKQQILIK